MKKKLSNLKIILASASPRRKEILRKAGFEFDIITADIDESYPSDIKTKHIAEYIASKKAKAVEAKVLNKEAIIIAADTIVENDGTILGKPKNKQEAIDTLHQLSNKSHQVITGVCIQQAERIVKFSAFTKVSFSKLNDEAIRHYVNHYEVMDKAGSYAIQDWIGLTYIQSIEGCYFNVVGLPMSLLYGKLMEFSSVS